MLGISSFPRTQRDTEFAEDITPQNLITLLSKSTNLLLVLSPTQTPLTSLAAEFSLIPAPPGTPLISHFPARSEPATVIPIKPPTEHAFISPGLPEVWYEGASFAYGNNPLLVPVLNAPPESFAADAASDAGADALVDAADKGGEGIWAGSRMGVVAGFQALGNARATWVGGVKLFSVDSEQCVSDFCNEHVDKPNFQVSLESEESIWLYKPCIY